MRGQEEEALVLPTPPVHTHACLPACPPHHVYSAWRSSPPVPSYASWNLLMQRPLSPSFHSHRQPHHLHMWLH